MSITILGIKRTQKLILKLDTGIKNLRPFFNSLEGDLNTAKDRQFSSRGSYLAENWEDLKASTRRSREAKGYGGSPILVNTGNLKGSFATKSVTRKELVYGSDNSYYKFHQLGTRKMAKRQILGISPALTRMIQAKLRKHISNLLK